jgi:hypothetical protein
VADTVLNLLADIKMGVKKRKKLMFGISKKKCQEKKEIKKKHFLIKNFK